MTMEKAVIKTDEQIAAVPRIGAGISGAEIWSTDQMPIDNSASADAAQRNHGLRDSVVG
jgi:hypothetical protein